MTPVLWYSLGIFIGLAGLWYSSERVVGASLVLAKRFSLNTLVIGALFMALVTGLPELLLSILSIANDAAQLSVGDIMGSNFIDTVVVIGFSALVAGTMKIGTQKRRHLLFLLGLVAAAMGFLFYLETIQPVMGVILIAAYIALVFFLWRSRHARAEATEAMEVEHLAEAQHEDHIVWYGSAHLAALAGFTQVALYSGKELAALYELPLEFLGATVFALATSLPEFVISLHSARRKAYGLLLGNALGAALQQGFFTMGVLAIFARTPIHLHEVSGLIWYMAVGFAILGISIWQQTIHRATGAAMVGLGILFFVQQAIQQLG
ncbi:MAG: hypothetical protein PVJ92_02830 [Candidatus Dependentiae bacterium]|jgi:cation:H+ antiporter